MYSEIVLVNDFINLDKIIFLSGVIDTIGIISAKI
jgi:hypothetical protein